MRASELRRQIVIQHASRVKDDFGSDVSTWATLATVYAKIEPLTGREFFAANEIVIRWHFAAFLHARTNATH